MTQALDPILAVTYPIGRRELYKQNWELAGLHGFDRLWPAELAQIETAAVVMVAEQKIQAIALAKEQMNQGMMPQQTGGAPVAQASPPNGNGNGQPPAIQPEMAGAV